VVRGWGIMGRVRGGQGGGRGVEQGQEEAEKMLVLLCYAMGENTRVRRCCAPVSAICCKASELACHKAA